VPDVPFLQLELARRMLALGQPAPAAVILRRELARGPADGSVAADLTKAEMEMGRFVEARAAARRALNLDARDRRSRERLVQINEVLALDPSQRGLSDKERFRRAQLLLGRVHKDLLSCSGPATSAANAAGASAAGAFPAGASDLAAALSTAEILLEDEDASGPPISRATDVQKPTDTTSSVATPGQASSPAQSSASPAAPSPRATSPAPTPSTLEERIDARLAAAEALWKARVARCGATSGPLAWIFDRVAS
jgi:hypothetical protein